MHPIFSVYKLLYFISGQYIFLFDFLTNKIKAIIDNLLTLICFFNIYFLKYFLVMRSLS